MGLMSFMKEAGQKLFGHKEAEAAQQKAEAAPDDEAAKARLEELNQNAAKAIVDYIHAQNLDANALDVMFDAATSTVNVYGVAADQETKEKILLCCGNVAGVATVNDKMEVEDPQPEAEYHEVVSGDNLSKIAKKFYGDANKYPLIFEANKPMLTHPDKTRSTPDSCCGFRRWNSSGRGGILKQNSGRIFERSRNRRQSWSFTFIRMLSVSGAGI